MDIAYQVADPTTTSRIVLLISRNKIRGQRWTVYDEGMNKTYKK